MFYVHVVISDESMPAFLQIDEILIRYFQVIAISISIRYFASQTSFERESIAVWRDKVSTYCSDPLISVTVSRNYQNSSVQ